MLPNFVDTAGTPALLAGAAPRGRLPAAELLSLLGARAAPAVMGSRVLPSQLWKLPVLLLPLLLLRDSRLPFRACLTAAAAPGAPAGVIGPSDAGSADRGSTTPAWREPAGPSLLPIAPKPDMSVHAASCPSTAERPTFAAGGGLGANGSTGKMLQMASMLASSLPIVPCRRHP